MKQLCSDILWSLPALLLFALLAWRLDFTQDDAYISYRYVANYLAGHGLVWNFGERVEGFTNFGWVVWQILWGGLGLSFIWVSKVTGAVLGGLTVFFGYKLARLVFVPGTQVWYAVVAVLLVGANASLAYWSPAGLETAAFVFCATLCVYFYIRQSWLLIAAMLWAVWLRPDGAVVCGLIIAVEAITERKLPKFSLISALVALVLSLPMVGFKLSYYGGILPNPFYAKTSFTGEQLSNGLEYARVFLKDYAFWGAGVVVAALFYRKLNDAAKVLFWFGLGYSLYVVIIGGDVLKVHRFFLPVVVPSAIVTLTAIFLILRRIRSISLQIGVLGLIAFGLIELTWFLPQPTVLKYNWWEKSLVHSMIFMGEQMKATDSTAFAVATPTIGSIGYTLLGHDVIDMVGLTDSTVARHPEAPVPGMQTTWKEARFNTPYLLSRGPEYVLFSTGLKPSAPAERALFLYKQFLDSYRIISWPYVGPEPDATPYENGVYKKMHPIVGPIVRSYPLAWVEALRDGMQVFNYDPKNGLAAFQKTFDLLPDSPYVYSMYFSASCLISLKRYDEARQLLDRIMARDSVVPYAHNQLLWFAAQHNDTANALIHQRWLLRLTPWVFNREMMIKEQMIKLGRYSH